MIAFQSCWWLLAITSYFSVLSIDKRVSDYFIVPSENVTCLTQPCFILNNYASVINEQHLLDNATFNFFPGIHHLDIELRIENASFVRLSEAWDSNVKIYVSLLGYIRFVDCDNIDISGLTFVLTEGPIVSETLRSRSSLIFHRTTAFLSNLTLFGNGTLRQSSTITIYTSQTKLSNVTVIGTRVHNSYGAALSALQSNLTFNGQNYFVNNNIYASREDSALGGAMLLVECIANFFGRILFLDNSAIADSDAHGGAVSSENSTLIFSGSALFQGNGAVTFQGKSSGGAIVAYSRSVLTFRTKSNVSFINNGAGFAGGAIRIELSRLKVQGIALFEANRANHGGAINGAINSLIYCSGGDIIFFNNIGMLNGGAMSVFSSQVLLEKVLFEDNRAGSLIGGALMISYSHLRISSSTFINNTAFLNAGAVYIGTSSVVIFNGINRFERNLSPHTAAVDILGANVVFSEENNFLSNNSTLDCGCLCLSYSTVLFSGRSTFYNNYGVYGGAIKGVKSNLTISGNSVFMNNTASLYGGAVMSFNGTLNITGRVSFVNNRANARATAFYAWNSDLTLDGSISVSGGCGITGATTEGAIYLLNSTALITGVSVSLTNNSGIEGGGIFSKESKVDCEGCITCLDNHAVSRGGGLFVLNSEIILRGNCSRFQSNIAHEGGAIYSENSTVYMTGTQTFMRNSAIRGGALALASNSKLTLTEPFQGDFVRNQATTHGGAIYFEDRTYSNVIQCIRPTNKGECLIELNSMTDIHLNFFHNTAGSAGTVLFGGGFDTCRLYLGGGIINSCGNRIGGHYHEGNPLDIIQNVSNIASDDKMTSKFSSEPLRVCFCETFGMECNIKRDEKIQTVRGKEFTLLAVTLGQNNSIVPSSVRASLSNDVEVSKVQRIQSTGKNCTPITYRLLTEKNNTELILFPDGPCRDNEISTRHISIDFLPCPDGFTLITSECACEDRLQPYTSKCNINDNSIERTSNTFWMGTVYNNGTFEGLILHSGCPFDYCIDTPVSVHLDNLNIQCNHNHSGTLCGSCNKNYSIVFGTLHCLPCSNNYLALILPFALAGVALVAIILLLRLSVATGTLNGLIFYANVVQLNHPIFLPPGSTNTLTVFIAWLNLDLGIETCFYDGMNIYIFTWLQFMFPFYVWFLIGMIILMSRYSHKIARSLGNNPVAALATLFLLSYSKILRTIITALSFTSLEYPGGIIKLVWLYDGNIPYFQRADHIALGVFAIIALLFLFLPYTFLLLCGHWLQAFSGWQILSWLNKIMPFMDAYHAPYKKESRYWTGFILLVRCALFLTFSFNILGNASVNLLAITSVTAGLAASAWVRKRVYDKLYNEILEISFILNLCILAAATYHVKETRGSQAKLANTSVGIAFATFICIVLYHVYVCIHKTSTWKKLPVPNLRKHFTLQKLGHNRGYNNKDQTRQNDNVVVNVPTTITIDLNELLLDM